MSPHQTKRDKSPVPIDWCPTVGWIILLPSKLPEQTEHGIVLPDSLTKKGNAGIAVKLSTSPMDEVYEDLLGMECFFPPHDEYSVRDSETEQEYYIVRADHIIMSRVPPRKSKFVQVLKGEREDAA